jgi:hypothetical protein
MRHILFIMLVVITCVSCTGKESDGGIIPDPPGGSNTLDASFVALNPTPVAGDINMVEYQANGNLVTVELRVTAVDDVRSASFDLTFDGSMVRFISHDPGSVFESGGNAPIYLVTGQTNRVVVGISRSGSAAAVNVSGTLPMIRLLFEAQSAGSTSLVFEGSNLFGTPQSGGTPPPALPNLTWSAGSMLAQ